MKHTAALLTALALFTSACGPKAGDPDPEPDPEPVYAMPELLGPGAVLEDTNPDPDIVEVTLVAYEATVDLGDGIVFQGYTYNGVVPGPTLQAKKGDRVIVHFENALPEATTVHWHGLRVSDDMDGSPRVQSPVEPDGTFTYDFVVPDAGSFWYHPHVRSYVQVERGLYGALVVHDPELDPTYDAERYLVLDDVAVEENGTLSPNVIAGMDGMHGRAGNVLLTNGTSVPTPVDVKEGQVERWRLVNTANARTLVLSIEGAEIRVIGTDGGLLETPYWVEGLELPVGQRYDLEVSYTEPGETNLLFHTLTYDENNNAVPVAIPMFTANVEATGENAPIILWPEVPAIEAKAATRSDTITLDAINDPTVGLQWRMNGEAHPEAPLFTFGEGEVSDLTIENLAGPEHPFHLHGQFFEILEPAGYPGLKDTVLVPGGSTVKVRAYLDNPGRWMAHCHILEHAELGMMSEVVVTPAQ